ncbi:hypothetical protein FOCC_FOCC014115 [Frankliniella occidentalis]|nr:hypothetical protein FOCC_FOCC014115 [Frankliniella occidentalis]
MCQIASKRLQALRLKVIMYNLAVSHVPGKEMYVADLLSRQYLPISTPNSDSDISDVLCVEDGVLLLNKRIVVPSSMRDQMLDLVHKAHLRVDKTVSRARFVLYWPGMYTDIKNRVENCSICDKYRPNQVKESLIQHEVPKLPYQKLGMDFAEAVGKDFLIVVDYMSKWIDIIPTKNKQASTVITELEKLFSTHGWPKTIVADNVPFGSYDFQNFAREHDIGLITSSPLYPQSNGMAEKAVGVAKNLIKKAIDSNSDMYQALTEYRNTPITGLGVSPAQMLMSRLLNNKLPIHESKLKPKVVNVEEKRKALQKMVKLKYDLNSRNSVQFQVGQKISFQKEKNGEWYQGVIKEKHFTPRSYVVQGPNNDYRRNTSFIRNSNVRNPVNCDNYSNVNVSHNDCDLGTPEEEIEPVIIKPVTESNAYVTRSGRAVKPNQKYL